MKKGGGGAGGCLQFSFYNYVYDYFIFWQLSLQLSFPLFP